MGCAHTLYFFSFFLSFSFSFFFFFCVEEGWNNFEQSRSDHGFVFQRMAALDRL